MALFNQGRLHESIGADGITEDTLFVAVDSVVVVFVEFAEGFNLLRMSGYENLIIGIESDVGIADVPVLAGFPFERNDRDAVAAADPH